MDALHQALEASLKARRVDGPPGAGPTPRGPAPSGAPATVTPPLPLPRAVDRWATRPGVGHRGADGSGTESGTERARCETAPRLAAWAGVAPGHDARAGQPRSGTTRQGHRPRRALLPPRAPAAGRITDPARSACSQRLAVRRGTPWAILAGAPSLRRRVLPRLARQAVSRVLGANACDARRRQAVHGRSTPPADGAPGVSWASRTGGSTRGMRNFQGNRGYPRIDELLLNLYATLLAQGTNMGLMEMAHSTNLSSDRLAWTNTWYLRDETLKAVVTALVNFQYKQPLAHHWGGGTLSSSDGQCFPVRGKVRNAVSLPKYFGYGQGITFYMWTSDQFSQYGTQVISTTVRDATYVLDEILDV